MASMHAAEARLSDGDLASLREAVQLLEQGIAWTLDKRACPERR